MEAVQDGPGKTCGEANSGSGATGCGRRTAGTAGPAAAASASISRSGSRSGMATPADGPRSPPKPPSPRAKMDRFCFHRTWPAGSVTVVSDQMTAALPCPRSPVNRVTAVRCPPPEWAGSADRLARVQRPRQLDVDAGELHRRQFRSCGMSGPRCRTSAAPTGCCRSGSATRAGPSGHGRRPSPRVVELHVGAGPAELDGAVQRR